MTNDLNFKKRLLLILGATAMALTISGCGIKSDNSSDIVTTKSEITTTGSSVNSNNQSDTSEIIEETPISEFVYEYSSKYDGMRITKYIGDSSVVAIPRVIGTTLVVAVGEKAFFNCDSVEQIIIPETVKCLQKFAFARCVNLKTVDIASNETEICDYAFYDSTSLSEIVVPLDFRGEIGISPFYNCNLMSNVSIPGYDNTYYSGTTAYKLYRFTEQLFTDLDTTGLYRGARSSDVILLRMHVSSSLDESGELVCSVEITNNELEESYDNSSDMWRKQDSDSSFPIRSGKDLKEYFEERYAKEVLRNELIDDVDVEISISRGKATLISPKSN